MKTEVILIGLFFVILISIQYTLNKILFEIRNIKNVVRFGKEAEIRKDELEKEEVSH